MYDESGTSFKKKISLRGEGISAVHEFISLSPAKYLIFSSSRNGNKMIWYDALKEQVYKEDYDLPSFLFSRHLIITRFLLSICMGIRFILFKAITVRFL